MHHKSMNKDTLINLRVNKSLKEEFQAIAEQEGFTMSEVLEASMRDIVKRKRVPFGIKTMIDKKVKPIVSIPYIKKCLDEIIAKNSDSKIKSASLFGSYSKGTATAASDIDLFIDVEEGFSLFDLIGLQKDLEKALGKKVDLVTKKDDDYFMNVIRKEEIKLYERRP